MGSLVLGKAKGFSKLATIALTAVVIAGCSSSGSVKDSGTDTGAVTTGTNSGSSLRVINSSNVGELQSVYYFDFDQSVIRPEALNDLSLHAQFLAGNPNASIRLEGHADEQGTREYNIALGERRAQSVEQFMVGRGVNRGQIDTISYGEEKPDISGLASKSRRVEVKYTAK